MRATAAIRAALECLPAVCRYHHAEIEPAPADRLYGREACCDTGLPALRRRRAEQALKLLEASDGPR